MEAGKEGAATAAQHSELIECTETIYRHRSTGLKAHFAVLLLVLWLGREPGVWPSNLVLVAVLLVYIAVAMATTAHVQRRRLDDASARRWVAAMYAQMVALGLIYNAIFINLHRHGVAHALEYLLMVLCFYCAGGAASYQYIKGMAVAYIVSAIAPLALYYLFSGEGQGLFMAGLLVLFILTMSGAALGLHADAIERLRLMRELNAAKNDAERLARTDSLTGLLNRRAFFDAGRAALAAAQRHQRPMAVAMLDLDHFKAVNDEFGHSVGDAVLVAFADIMRKTQRLSDFIGRLGGEEFAIVMPDTDLDTAEAVAERMRLVVAALEVDPVPRITASLGVAESMAGDDTLDGLIARADQALYRAKSLGRDRVVSAPA